MSEKLKTPTGLWQMFLPLVLGAAAAAGCVVGMASLMVSRELSQSVVWPLATAAVSAGSLFSGWLSAYLQKRRGLICGAVQGVLFAAFLLLLQLWQGTIPERMQLIRFGLVVFFGCVGGFCGMLRVERKRRR